MKTYIVIFLALLLSAPALAQQPRIDSIAVDEDQGELVLHGDFPNSASAVDTVSLQVTLTSDTLLRATIPVSGSGSAGRVQVIILGNGSNQKLLSYIHFFVRHCYSWVSHQVIIQSTNFDTIHVRFDFDNLILPTIIRSSKSSKCRDFSSTYQKELNFDSSGILNTTVLFDPSSKVLTYDIIFQHMVVQQILKPKFNWITHFTPIALNMYINNPCSGYGSGNGHEGFAWGPISPTDFPPSSSGINEVTYNSNILQAHLSSNPIASNAEAMITLNGPMKIQMQIMDILGHIISSEEKMLSAGINSLPINSSKFDSGIYICRLQAGGEVVSLRFVKE